MPLYLLSRCRFVSCPVFLLTMVMVDCPVLSQLFRAPAECYSAFVEIVSSECESADDIRTLNSWPLHIEPAHSRVWEGACLLRRIQSTGCVPPAEETEECAARIQSYILHSLTQPDPSLIVQHQGEAIIKACATAAPACVVCPFLPSPFALRTYIYIYT